MVRVAPAFSMAASIQSIDLLIAALEAAPTGQQQLDVLRSMDVPMEEFERRVNWNTKHYTRTCIARNRYFELLLIGFEPGQQTSIHDYNGHEAWVHPLTGELTEERFEPLDGGKLRPVSSVLLGPRSFSYLGNSHSIHRFVNTGNTRCLSLNLYCGPIRKWKVYDARSGRTTTVGTPEA